MPESLSALLVHGAGGGGWEWNRWRGVFAARGIAVHAPDLQPSPRGLVATTFDDYLDQVRTAVVALAPPRVLIGASLGGLLAMRCADAVDALVLVNPLPPAPWHALLPGRDWADRVPWHRDARLATTREALVDADEATVLYAFRRWRDESGAVLRAAHAGVAVDAPPCRVLCVLSQQDDDVPPASGLALARAWDTSVLQLASPSHVGPLLGRAAAGVATQVVDWLSPG